MLELLKSIIRISCSIGGLVIDRELVGGILTEAGRYNERCPLRYLGGRSR